MRTALRAIFHLCVVCAAVCTIAPNNVWADAEVSIDVDPSTGTTQDVFTLRVTVSGSHAAEVGAPSFEDSPEFTLQAAGTATSHTNINGATSSAITYSYALTPAPGLKPGDYLAPQGSFTFNGKTVKLKRPGVRITTEPDLPRATGQEGISFVQVVSNTAPFVGQQILYKAEVAASARVSEAVLSDIQFDGFWSESFGKAREAVRNVGGINTRIYTVREALFPTQAGSITIAPRTLSTKVEVPRRQQQQRQGRWGMFNDPFFGGDDFFGLMHSYDVVQKRFMAKQVQLEVRPLPPAPITGLKYTPVGKFSMTADVDKHDVKQGDTVNLTITVSGDGNLRPYELDDADYPRERFRLYPDKPKVETNVEGETVHFTKTFSVAFVPLVSGQFNLPQYRIIWFDPTEEKYHVQQTDPFALNVTADPSARTLEVTGSPESPSIRTTKTVDLLGRDLLPQHTGVETLQPAPTLPGYVLYLVIVIPLAAFGLRVSAERTSQLLKDPARLRRMVAHRRLLEGLNTVGDVSAADAFRRYLGERFGNDGAALTAHEAAKLVREATGDEKLAGRVQSYLLSVERSKYGGGNDGGLGDISQSARQLAEDIEKGLTKR